MQAVLPIAWPPNPRRIRDLLRLWCAPWLARMLDAEPAEASVAESFESLVERHRGPLERLCSFRERDPSRRQDLWQDMLFALWKSLPNFRGEGSELAWVLKVAHNVAATHVARAMRDRRLRHELELEEPVDDLSRDIELRDLMKRVRALDFEHQQLVLLYLEGLSSEEIAQATGLSTSNVTTRLSRIRKRLAGGGTQRHGGAE